MIRIVTIRRNDKKQTVVCRAWLARSIWQRLRGLIGRPRLKQGEGLLITPCNSVHTIGMRYALDLVFFDKNKRVLKCVAGLTPYRVAGALAARHALELPPGSIERAQIGVGDQLSWAQHGDPVADGEVGSVSV